mgnify:FL=1
MKINVKIILYLCAVSGLFLLSQHCNGSALSVSTVAEEDSVDMIIDDNDQYIRENPKMDPMTEETGSLQINYRKYPFVKRKANNIEFNGADWSGLRNLFTHAGDTVVSIVHIGDSHLQSEGSTQRVRSLLQKRYGSAGRGLIVPFKLAGTNQPSDYLIQSGSSFTTSRIQRKPWTAGMGFTGIALKPRNKSFDFTISMRRSEGSEPDFDIVKMFCGGNLPRLISVKADGTQVGFTQTPKVDTLEIFLHEPAEMVDMHFSSSGDCSVYGVQPQNQRAGIEYSAIGNNGASMQSYLGYGKMGQGLQTFRPALVIISLGSNEAFGDVDESLCYQQIDQMVNDIKRYNPQAQILLTTPGECQRSSVSYTGTGKNKKAVRSYGPNTKCETVRNIILRYGKEHNVATWDWWNVAGGRGCSVQWLETGLLQGDRIHNTWDGYHLQGNLLYEALVKAVEK